jgi:hypothetical protein
VVEQSLALEEWQGAQVLETGMSEEYEVDLRHVRQKQVEVGLGVGLILATVEKHGNIANSEETGVCLVGMLG